MSVNAVKDGSALLRSVSAIALATVVGLGGQAQARTATATAAAAPTVEDVVVTAERRLNSVQKTPAAITAVQSESLDKGFVNDISGLNAVTPGLEITKTAGAENLVTIRGVGSETPENTLTTSPGVSQFIDGVYIVSSISFDQALADVDRVEVLRGPQGDLYGQSSIGGAINIVTKQPRLQVFSGSGDVSAGDYNLFRERLGLNIPLGDTFALRLSGQKLDHDGFTRDTYFNNFYEDDAHNTSLKAAGLWKPSDSFSATLTGMWYRATEHGPAQKNILETGPYLEVLAINPKAPPVSPLSSDPYKIYQDFKGQFDLTTQLYHLNLDWRTPFADIRSVTGYQHLDHSSREDSSRSAVNVLGSYDSLPNWTDHVTSYTEEFDLLSKPGSPLQWIAGAFMLDQVARSTIAEFETPSSTALIACPGGIDPGSPASLTDIRISPPCNLAYANATDDTRQGFAGFLRLTYRLTPKLRLQAGVRYNFDRYSNSSHNFSASGASTASYVSTTAMPTWRFEADYALTADNTVYASITRGYKPGGANGNAGQKVVKNLFLAETNDAFELGSKNYFLGRLLQLNLAGFYYDHRNFQYIEQDPVPFDAGIANIPHVRDYGGEVEAHLLDPSGKLHLDASLGLEKGEVLGKYLTIDSTTANRLEGPGYSGGYETNFATSTFGPCAFSGAFYAPACWAEVIAAAKNIQGKEPPAMPNVSGSISAAYDFDTGFGVLTPWVQYIYRGHEWARIFNEPSLDNVPAYGVVNLNVGFTPDRYAGLKLSLAATNVTGVAGINSQYTDPYGTAQTSRQYISPRQVVGMIAYSF